MQGLDEHSAKQARQIGARYAETLNAMEHGKLVRLTLLLLNKRNCDGLNGRCWDAHAHLLFEQRIEEMLDTSNNGVTGVTTNGRNVQ
jgi:hypothetical protein